METKEYYYGTSSDVDVVKRLSPTNTKSMGKKTIQVTNSLESAIYYAKKASENSKENGTPVVYVVEPVMRDLLQKNSTDFITSSAKVISIKEIEEFA